ncbi:MAG: PHP domain-containing protein [Spirochaetaceae bacterium]|nr:MAG: PHP domain-containing protein [Spirochaetaceae bacterium]
MSSRIPGITTANYPVDSFLQLVLGLSSCIVLLSVVPAEGQLHTLEDDLNHPTVEKRLQAIHQLAGKLEGGEIPPPVAGEDVNNHIHTIYSFSPYSPALAVWNSYKAGLRTAGIMDHDSISGAEEFIEAGRIIGLATTIGVECRCDFSATSLAGRRINNPDQLSNAYIALHGIPHTQIEKVSAFFQPFREARNRRNRKMVEGLNGVVREPALLLDFDADVLPLSMHQEGGSITERHILFALAGRLIDRFGRGAPLLIFLREKLRLKIGARVRELLEDQTNPHYTYDLLGALKSDLVGRFYIDAGDECPGIEECLAFCERVGAISAYAYLGDISESVTGDKKAQSFEDSYLEELFEILRDLGFRAVTYMPNRNTPEQLARVQSLCRKHALFEISGVDINSPRQSFTCPEIRRDQFRHLIDSTWALIGHEAAATEDLSRGMFAREAIEKYPTLEQRIAAFGQIGRSRGEIGRRVHDPVSGDRGVSQSGTT